MTILLILSSGILFVCLHNYGEEGAQLNDSILKNKNIFSKIKLTYIATFIFWLVCFFVRYLSIQNDPKLKHFPERWEPNDSCSRVAFKDSQRDYNVDYRNVIAFSNNEYAELLFSEIIESCVESEVNSEIVDRSMDPNSKLFHATFSSMIFGFVDDMYIEILPCTIYRYRYYNSIQIQSNSRLGSFDLGVNPKRVARMYKCIFDKTDQNLRFSRYINKSVVWIGD